MEWFQEILIELEVLGEFASINVDTLKTGLILDDVRRKAKGYIKINNKEKIITLYDNAELYYMDIELKSGVIKFNWENSVVSAGRIKDSIGNFTQAPIFKQGGDEINPDSLRYNFDSKKALIWNSRTKQNGVFGWMEEMTFTTAPTKSIWIRALELKEKSQTHWW